MTRMKIREMRLENIPQIYLRERAGLFIISRIAKDSLTRVRLSPACYNISLSFYHENTATRRPSRQDQAIRVAAFPYCPSCVSVSDGKAVSPSRARPTSICRGRLRLLPRELQAGATLRAKRSRMVEEKSGEGGYNDACRTVRRTRFRRDCSAAFTFDLPAFYPQRITRIPPRQPPHPFPRRLCASNAPAPARPRRQPGSTLAGSRIHRFAHVSAH